ncbi:MAG: Fe/S biogenesis protein NfuA [Candidatus Eisenbacteria bacterium RBG_16_71_46]|nr:MAG: Fe/S biogenesis protein NfuA [Candidatus Eisenbacteria bacterium RBG_16_71_46]
MVTITEKASEKIRELIAAEKREGLALRFGIGGRGLNGFTYVLRFVPLSERGAGDTAIDAGGFTVLVDAESATHLAGASVDYVETAQGGGFKIENPNPLWTDPRARAVQEVIDRDINPAVASHGGFVTLLDVRDDVAYIALGGGCQGCGMVDVTLKQGIEVRIREAVPGIREIVDSTDHAGGSNPYYRPSKGGQSPLA